MLILYWCSASIVADTIWTLSNPIWFRNLYVIKKIEPTVILKANDFISFNFGDLQFLDIMKYLGGAPTMDSFVKAYKASQTKSFFPYEQFDSPDKLDCTELPPFENFFSKLRNHNPLEKYFNDYQKLDYGRLDQQSALKK